MSLEVIVSLVFIATSALLLSGLFMILDLMRRRRLSNRLEAVKQIVATDSDQISIELLKQTNAFDRALLKLRGFRRLPLLVEQSGVQTEGYLILSLSLALGLLTLVICLVAGLPWALVGVLAVSAATTPFLFLFQRRHRRFRRFEELFPDAIDMLARAVRAGYAFTSALELIAQELPDPVAGEFQITYDQQNLGLPLGDALSNLSIRMPHPDVRIFVVLLKLHQESGGNLAEMLDNLAGLIRERFKLLRQVQVFTAEGRLSMMVLAFLPLAAAAGFLLTNPNYIMPLFTDPLGHQMIATAIVMQIVGVLLIRRIVRLEV